MYQKSIALVLLLVQHGVGLPAPDGYSGVTNNGAYDVSDASLNVNVGGSIARPAQNAMEPPNMAANGAAPNYQANRQGLAYGNTIDTMGPQQVITSTIVITWTKAGASYPTMAPNGAQVGTNGFIAASPPQGPTVEAFSASSAPLIPTNNHYEDASISSSGYSTSGSAQVNLVPEPSSHASVIGDPAPQPAPSTFPPDSAPSSNAADESSDTTTDDDLIPPITRAPRLPTFTDVPPRFSTIRIESMASKNGLLQTALNGIQTILPVIDGLGLLGIESEGTYLNLPGLLEAIDIPCLFRCNTPPAPASPQPGAVPQAPAPVQAPPVAVPPAGGVPAGAGVVGSGAEAGAGAVGGGLVGGVAGSVPAAGGVLAGGAEAAGSALGSGAEAIGGSVLRAPAEVPPVQVPPAQVGAVQAPEVAGGPANNPLLGSPGRNLLKGLEDGIQNGYDQSGGSPGINNAPQSLDGQTNDVLSNVGPQSGSDSAANAPVNGMENSNSNDMIAPLAASSSASPQPVQSGLDSSTGNIMYPPPMPPTPPQASHVQDGLQRGINDNIASAGGLNNGYGNNMAPPEGSIAPSTPQASPLQNGLFTGMGNNMRPAGNMGQVMPPLAPPAAATMNGFLSGVQGSPASVQTIQPDVPHGVPMGVPVQMNSAANGPLINAGASPIYRGSSSMPLFPIPTMVTSPSLSPSVTPGPSPTPTPTPTPTAASTSEPPPVTTTQFNGEVVSCASGKYPDDDHEATPECAGETKVISTVESIASAYAASVSAEASAAASKSAAEAAEASWTSAAAKPSASCDILDDNGLNKVVFRIAGINGWTDGQSFSNVLKKRCHKNNFFISFHITHYLFYAHEKSEFQGRQRDTEKVTFTMSGFKNGCVEDAIEEAGGPKHGKGEGELTCQHKKEDKLPSENTKDAKEAGENVEDLVFIPSTT
ncbi:hypothetical protein BDV38DRAFT_279008 [Aspergillus pseudotamarii]|uniref:Uncharacterized protein n=1 Tax=Aspergillus pseudotamarii TaxID=132259 RepID=A0A5N6T5Q7_ASPPS|nr:uncharacterized protein BDV38DRAFT_279008 [Aspergillus pseudotamarii]KAE8141654.1 hypothetical protein BDV38DRAFT_279008 [Aspergillus pseudotamarii]